MALKITYIVLVLALMAVWGPFEVEGCEFIFKLLGGLFSGGNRQEHQPQPQIVYIPMPYDGRINGNIIN